MDTSYKASLDSLSAGLKAEVLIEALPYIQNLTGRTVVIKYGGSAMTDPELIKHVIADIILLRFIGIRPVIVHGGGPEINKTLKQLNISSEVIGGLRKTSSDAMAVVQMVLAGKVNKHITGLLERQGAKAVGISGIDASLFTCEKIKLEVNGEEQDLGFVGKITGVDTTLIETLSKDYIPVIAPLGTDLDGQSYNINADTAAAELASALGADKLILLTDVEGVMQEKDGQQEIIPVLTEREANDLIDKGVISGGMIPKVLACVQTVKRGVRRVHIIDGRLPHSILLEIFTHKGIGTMFTNQRRPYFPGETI